MNISDLQNKLIAILGFGAKEGVATAEYLLKHGIKPVLFDERPWEAWANDQQEYIRSLGVNFIFGPDCLKELASFDVIFRNPAFPRLKQELVDLEKKGIIITSQIKWFMDHCPAHVIGVTGTKGKGTTSTLISKILSADLQRKNARGRVYLTGNIGEIQPFEFLDNITEDDWVVYEMSSFQLQDLSISPHIAVVLMITAEHLDHHQSIEEYHLAKANITAHQKPLDHAIFNSDYPASVKIGHMGLGAKHSVSTKAANGAECIAEEGAIKLLQDGIFQTLCLTKDLKLRGSHNWENICAAALAARYAGSSLETIRDEILFFSGLEHRLEFLGTHNRISYYNDSFSTTPETAIAAIHAFTEPEVVILGGSTKNSDFTELGKVISEAKNIRGLVVIGDETRRIVDAISQHERTEIPILTGAQTMGDIISQAHSIAKTGDVIVLSPACASFGMFRNYKDRGNQFKEAVKKLGKEIEID